MQEFIRSFNKFTRWKNVKNNNRKYKSNFYRRVLLDKIHNKHQSIEKLREDPTTSMENCHLQQPCLKASYLEYLLTGHY